MELLPVIAGYTPQRMVPLYVRNSLEEKEGTSKHGDPCKEELAQDRRYSHYLGRPLVRFNPSVDTVDAWSSLSSTSRSKDVASIVEDPPKTSSEEIDDVNLDLAALSLTSKDKKHQAQKLDKKTRKELKKAQEEVRHLPITNSLVRLVFNNPEPTLSDLKYLDEVF